MDYVGEFDKLNSMAADLTNQTDIIDKVDSWTLEFERYGSVYNLMDFDHQVLNKSVFNEVLTQFLFSPKGGRYRQQFKFKNDLGVVHQIVSPISNSESTKFLTNISYYFFFNWQIEKKKHCLGPIRSSFSFSTAQTEKNLWKKFVKTSDEFVIYLKNSMRISNWSQ